MVITANLRQAKTDDEIKKLTVNNVKKAYHDLALDYNHLLDLDYVYCPHCGKWKSSRTFYTKKKNITTKNIIITFCDNYTLTDSENKGRCSYF